MLSGGGKQVKDASDPKCWYSGPNFDYVDTVIWRCHDMEVLAGRLSMAEHADDKVG